MPTLKRIYIYRESHLPENGWLQACFRCKAITGNIFYLKPFIIMITYMNFIYIYVVTVINTLKEIKNLI